MNTKRRPRPPPPSILLIYVVGNIYLFIKHNVLHYSSYLLYNLTAGISRHSKGGSLDFFPYLYRFSKLIRKVVEVGTHHFDDLWVDGLRKHAAAGRNVFDQLVESASLDLLALQIGHGVHEVERHAALAQFADQQLLLLR